jgi:sarcosine oxidase, subunit beta
MFGNSKRFWKEVPLKGNHEAVTIGGGLHGLATAYFLASRHGNTDVAVIEKQVIGSGAFGATWCRASSRPAKTDSVMPFAPSSL